MLRTTLPLFVLSFLLMAGGPCEMIEETEDQDNSGIDKTDTGEPSPEDADGCAWEQCRDTLSIRMVTALMEPVNSGIYAFSVETPEGIVAMECSLYYAEAGFECYAGDTAYLDVSLSSEGGGIHLTMYGAPETVGIVVEYNNWRIGEALISPAYEGIFLNGPECPATCQVAEETMALQSP